jgi:hypothetical protein
VTFNEAKDFMFKILNDTVSPLSILIKWTEIQAALPAANLFWIRPTLKHTKGNVASLGSANGTTLKDRHGFLIIQVFSPLSGNLSENYTLCQTIVTAYENYRDSCLWFKDIGIQEIGQDGFFQQININITFRYEG